MAVNWNLAGDGFDALQSLQVAGQARQQQQAAQQRQLALQQQQRTQMAAQQAAGQLGAGDYQGATRTALQAGDFDLVKHIGGLREDHQKELLEGFKTLGQYALLADTPQKWDEYVQGFIQQGHPEAAGYLGKFNLRGQILAQAGLAKEYADQQKIDYKVVPPGGYLQGFGANGQPIGNVQTSPIQAVAVPDAAVQHLRQNPSLAPAFDAKYGAGASQQYLGGAPSQGGATFP